jgi:proteic killer suppression protein
MIRSFRHKGLKRLYLLGDRAGIGAAHVERIENILSILAAARQLADIDLPSLRLHALKGDMKGRYAVTVQANWRIVFAFRAGECTDIDLVDYH